MIAVYILLGVLGVFVLLFLAAVINTFRIKRTIVQNEPLNPDIKLDGMEYAKKLSQLIAVETVAEPLDAQTDKFENYYKVIEKTYSEVFNHLERIRLGNNFLARLKGQDSRLEPILLMAHADVVEANPEGWDFPPYSGAIENGVLYGRGTLDTKGAFGAYMSAIEELLKIGKRPKRDVYLLATCDEEPFRDGALQAVSYFKENNIRFYNVIDEGGYISNAQLLGIRGDIALIGIVEKGKGDIVFKAKSNGGHSSAPAKNNPLARLGALMSDVNKRHPFTCKFTKESKETFKNMSYYMSFPFRLILGNLWLFMPILSLVGRMVPQLKALMTTTMVFTMAKGSGAENVIPDEASVNANLRYIMHCPPEKAIKILEKKYLKKYNIEMEEKARFECSKTTDINNEGYIRYKEMIKDYFSVAVIPFVIPGMTHSRYMHEVSDCVLRFTPFRVTIKQLNGVHGKNENVYVDSLEKAVGFFIYYLENV